jgi:hypothetical protein
MRILKYKKFYIYESILDDKNYDADWKMPKNPVREMLEDDLRDILLEIEDLGYRILLGGFVKGPFGFNRPYVWIKNGNGQPLNKDEIEDSVIRIEDYLQINGFKTERVLGSQRLHIYFDKIDSHIRENKINLIYDLEDILNDLEEVGLEYEVSKKPGCDPATASRLSLKIPFFKHLEITIERPYNSFDREIPGAPVPPGGKCRKDIFIWREVKDIIIRLNQWYFQEFKNVNFKMYSSGVEFGIGWNKEEDFSGIGDLISFTNLKIVFRIE